MNSDYFSQLLSSLRSTFESTSNAHQIPLRRQLVMHAEQFERATDHQVQQQQLAEILCDALRLCDQHNWSPAEIIDKYLKAKGGHGTEAKENQQSSEIKRRPKKKVALLVESFDPPTIYHRSLVERLTQEGFDQVVICPIVSDTKRGEFEHASARHRAALTTLGFRYLDHVRIDYTDLSESQPTQWCELLKRLPAGDDVWCVVDSLALQFNDAQAVSPIRRELSRHGELWKSSQFIVVHRPDDPPSPSDLPPRSRLLAFDKRLNSSDLRSKLYAGESIESWITEDVAHYIQRHLLFLPYSQRQLPAFQLPQPKLKIVFDERNAKSRQLAELYRPYESSTPNLLLVLGGDGTMLHAIREHWRLRIPFLGMNTGHLGFLMNEHLPTDLHDLPVVSYSLPLLRVDATTQHAPLEMELAFSDVWVERAEGQAAWIRVDVDRETRLSKVVGDGLLVSTAAGSSAYARAMGALPVPIDTPTLTLAGSNIFQPRFWKPMALADSSIVTLASLDYSGKRPLRGYVDGQPLGLVQELRIKQSLTASVEMVFTTQFDPSARLLRSLFPPAE